MLDSGLETFIEGFVGSVLIEVVTIYEYYSQEIDFPPRYTKVGFWSVRVMIAVAGGFLAYIQGVRNAPVLAINVGASAPLLIRAFGGGIKKD